MKRRQFLQSLACASVGLLLSTQLNAQILTPGNNVSLRCLGNIPGARYLDGRTGDGTVGLAPNLTPKYSGTKWRVYRAGDGIVALFCLGNIQGPRWLDGRTADGTVGLAPGTKKPYTGTRWQVVQIDSNNPNIVALKCLGDIEGPRWLDGRTGNGTVGLASTTQPPFTGTKWEAQMYPVTIDENQ
jgi:hypothetical protein